MESAVILHNVSPDQLREMIDQAVAKAVANQDSSLISMREACQKLRVGKEKFKALQLPAYKVGKSIYYRLSDLKNKQI